MSNPDTNELLQQLEQLDSEATAAFESATDSENVESARVTYLGRKNGRLQEFELAFKKMPPEGKKQFGRPFNEAKKKLKGLYAEAKERIASSTARGTDATGGYDFSLPGSITRLGTSHPLVQTAEELVEIFGRLGFSVATGPEIEDEWHNFQALNIPAAHPARDPVENFYFDEQTLLRSQTSTVQIRTMEKQKPPLRVISIGRVYRPDTVDATHHCMFHQIEGLYIDEAVTMADLKSVLRLFASTYLGEDVHVRFRPSFFPFTEPSVEVDMSWGITGGKWVELGGAGMVDPNVLEAVGYDPDQCTGFAFGLGVERMCMRRHGIKDIRNFLDNDIRFLRQF